MRCWSCRMAPRGEHFGGPGPPQDVTRTGSSALLGNELSRCRRTVAGRPALPDRPMRGHLVDRCLRPAAASCPDHAGLCLASDSALGGGFSVLASRRLTSLFSLLAGALLGATLYLHHSTALPLAVAAAVELASVTVFARTPGSHILDR